MRRWLPLVAIFAGFTAGTDAAEVTVRGRQILIDGEPRQLLGFRVGSAALRDDWTRELISQLDEWRAHGVNALTLWLQGTSGGYARVFTRDGRAFETEPQPVIARAGYGLNEESATVAFSNGVEIAARTARIIDEADRRGMVVVLGVIYRSAVAPDEPPATIASAMQTTARAFGRHGNVIFNVWNEIDVERPAESPAEIARYAQALRAAAPRRPVCAGSNRTEASVRLAALPEVDLACHDAGRTLADTLAAYEATAAVGKAVINVESYGASGGGYVDATGAAEAPPDYSLRFASGSGWLRVFGAWRDEDYADATGRPLLGRRAYLQLIDYVTADATLQRHLLVHVAGWFQGASRVERAGQIDEAGESGKWTNVFRSGPGKGNTAEPGIRWLLEAIDRGRGRRSE